MNKLSKNLAKYIVSLQRKKHRQEQQCFLIAGSKIVEEVLHNASLQVPYLLATDNWLAQYGQEVEQLPHINTIIGVNEQELKKISPQQTPDSVIAVCKMPNKASLLPLQAPLQQPILVLDSLRDPGNLGTLIRLADWFALSGIICSLDSVDCYNFKVVQASMGSILRLPVQYAPLAEVCQNAQAVQLPIYGALLGGQSIASISFDTKGLLLIGNESKGISAALQPYISHKVGIVRGKGSCAESLNAAMAASIITAKAVGAV